jgi:hypothetical protein
MSRGPQARRLHRLVGQAREHRPYAACASPTTIAPQTLLQYAAGMSAKQQLAELVAELPENVSLQEAFERLYQAYQDKLRQVGRRRNLGALAGRVKMSDDFDAPLPKSVLAEFEGR